MSIQNQSDPLDLPPGDLAEFFSSILVTIPDAVYVFDLETNANVWSNREIGTLIGYSPSELIDMGDQFFVQVLHPDDIARLPALLQRWEAAHDDDVLGTEYRMRHKDGSYRWFQARDKVYARNDAGSVTRILGATWDVTSLKEQEHKRLELERVIASKQKLETLGLLASVMAHEISGPLTAIEGFSELLHLKLGDNPDVEQFVSRIKGAAERVNALSDRLLKYARKESVELEAKSPTEVIKETVDLLLPWIRKSSVKLNVSIAPNLPETSVDSLAIQQVLTNLITNGVQAITSIEQENGAVTVRISGSDNQLRFEVEDNGPGIPEDMRPRLFESFFTTKSKGTGLGLAICTNILLESGSQLQFSSVPGSTKFWFELSPNAT